MVEFRDNSVSIAFDICGCPNRCRHCWLGCSSSGEMDRREIFREFERIRDQGIQPGWQLFQTKKILPELDGILKAVDELRLEQRVADLGGEFELFIHDPDPVGEAMRLEPPEN